MATAQQAGLSPSSALGAATRKEGEAHPFLGAFFLAVAPEPSTGCLGTRPGSGEHPIFAAAPCQARQSSALTSQVPGSSPCREGRRRVPSLCSFGPGLAGPWTRLCPGLCHQLLLAARAGRGSCAHLAGSPLVLAGARGPRRPREEVGCRLGEGCGLLSWNPKHQGVCPCPALLVKKARWSGGDCPRRANTTRAPR